MSNRKLRNEVLELRGELAKLRSELEQLHALFQSRPVELPSPYCPVDPLPYIVPPHYPHFGDPIFPPTYITCGARQF